MIKIDSKVEITEGNIRIEVHGTGFSIQVLSDPEQHDKILYFHYAESVKTAIEKAIEYKEAISKLNK